MLDEQATKQAMVEAFAGLIGDALAGDVVALTFSRHGSARLARIGRCRASCR